MQWIQTPEAGIYPDVPAETYHRWDAMSASWIGRLEDTSPKHFRRMRQHPPRPTEAMEFGTLLHKLLIEPFDFAAEFAVAPKCDRRTTAGKKRWAEFGAIAEGKTVSTKADYEQARAMAHAIMHGDNAAARKLLTGGQSETSIVWDDPTTGIRCKARLDYWNEPFIPDVKSTLSCNPKQFIKSIWNYGYHRQYAMYTDGMAQLAGRNDIRFLFIAAEKSEPWDVVVGPRTPDEHRMIYVTGRNAYKATLTTYKECRDNDHWPGYADEDGLVSLELPSWILRQEGLVGEGSLVT